MSLLLGAIGGLIGIGGSALYVSSVLEERTLAFEISKTAAEVEAIVSSINVPTQPNAAGNKPLRITGRDAESAIEFPAWMDDRAIREGLKEIAPTWFPAALKKRYNKVLNVTYVYGGAEEGDTSAKPYLFGELRNSVHRAVEPSRPTLTSFALACLLPVFGFLLPWITTRSIAWVIEGFHLRGAHKP